MRKQLRFAVLVLSLVFFGVNLAMACATIAPEAMSKGAELVRAGKSQEAIEQFNIGLADGYHNRGEAYQIAGMWSEALADFNKATAINPKDSRPYLGRAQYFVHLGKLDEAMEELNASVGAKDDFSGWSLPLRSWIHHIKGELDLAVQDYNTMLQNDPHNPIYTALRAFAYHEMGDQENALADFNNALALNDKIVFAYFGRSLVYDAKGDAVLAQSDLNKVRQMDASLAELYAKKAKDLKSYGLVKGARKYLKYSFIINPDLKNKYKDLDQDLNPVQAAVSLEKNNS